MDFLFIKPLNDIAPAYYKPNNPFERNDSGYDLFYCGETIVIPPHEVAMLGLGIACQLRDNDNGYKSSYNKINVHGYELWPRSSIYKSNLMLANGIGLIDFGYRGEIKACVRNMSPLSTTVKTGDRLFQLCMPDKRPFYVCLADELSESVRGEGGFGSTDDLVPDNHLTEAEQSSLDSIVAANDKLFFKSLESEIDTDIAINLRLI
jgi:dUTP pyrophosphatase